MSDETTQASASGGTRYRNMDQMKCGACNWSGHEGQMIWLDILFTQGWYAGGCPNCDARNIPLGRDIITKIGGHQTVEVDKNNYPIGMKTGVI